MDKHEIREQVRLKKKQLTPSQLERAGKELLRQLLAEPVYRQASCICGYMSCNQEVRMLPILQQAMLDGKQVAVPKIISGEMRFVLLTDLRAVASGYAGIPEPLADEPVVTDASALLVLPGLAFDRRGNRIGYGSGFYDRYLQAHPEQPTIALCYDFQFYDCLPAEPFDVPVQQVLWANTQ